MARANAIAVACVLLVSLGMACAQVKLCNDQKLPSTPFNTLITSNQPGEPGKAQIKMTWRTGIKNAGDGCVSAYAIQVFDKTSNGVFNDMINVTPGQEQMSHTLSHPAARDVTIKIQPQFRDKKGPWTEVGTIKTAGQPTQKPQPL